MHEGANGKSTKNRIMMGTVGDGPTAQVNDSINKSVMGMKARLWIGGMR
jgi:hypothetical protein